MNLNMRASVCLAAILLVGAICGAEPLRFGLTRYAIGSVDDADAILANRINLAHLHCPASGWAYDGFPERAEFDRAMADFKAKAEKLTAHGVHVITYIAPHMWYGDQNKRTLIFNFYDKRWDEYRDFLGPKPSDPIEWTQRDANGKPVVYKYKDMSGYYWCVDNPNTRRYVEGVIRMHVTYGSHGIFFDGPAMFGGYCKYCQRGFRQYLRDHLDATDLARVTGGVAVDEVTPPADDSNLPLATMWRRFRCASLTKFVRDMRAYGRSLCPDFVLTNNYCMWGGDAVGIARSLGENPEMYAGVEDIVFDEAAYGGGSHLGGNGKRISNSFQYDYLVAAAGSRPATCTFMGLQNTPSKAIASLAWLEIAESWASQCIKMQQNLRQPEMNAVFRQAGQFQVDHPELFAPAKPYATVGVWVSLQQGMAGKPTYGMTVARMLQDQGIAYRVVTDSDLSAGRLEGLTCVIVPNAPLVSSSQLAALRGLLARGGAVVAMGQIADMNENALPRAKKARGAFSDGPPGTGLRSSSVGKGQLLWLSLKDFPNLPTISKGPVDSGQEAALAEAVRRACGDHRVLLSAPPLPVECRVYRVGQDHLRAYLVNYGVHGDGTVDDVRQCAFSLALPEGYGVASATAYSNDPQQQAVGVRVTGTSGHQAARFTVPDLKIWTVLDVRLQRGK